MTNKAVLTLVVILVVTVTAAQGQTYSVLYNLGSKSNDPLNPANLGVFAQGRDGNLYSTSQNGGANGKGTVFQLTPTGSVTVLHSFEDTTGSTPASGLTLGTDGNLYGTTISGGTFNDGVLFKISTGGTYTVVHNFDLGSGEGFDSEAPPIQGADGSFYGTLKQTGIGFGAVYKMTTSGTFSIIFKFSSNSDGSGPGALTLGNDGNLYGITATGGANDRGAIFKLTPQGAFTLLHSFTDAEGFDLIGAMIQANDGNFYGTAWQEGPSGGGVVYKISPAGVFSDIFSFGTDITQGLFPFAGVIQATDGNLYGATAAWGLGFGTLYQLTTAGVFSLSHTFTFSDGGAPSVTPFQHTNGSLYGDTGAGGTAFQGVLYKLDLGLKTFVSFLPATGKVGSTVQFLGQGFTGTTAVKFNGANATFSVKSDTFLTATVPSGATTGLVTVTTPSGRLASNRKFRVKP